MALKNSSRHYTGRILATQNQKELLEENFHNFQRMFSVGYDRILTLCGSYFPKGENQPDQESFKDYKVVLENSKDGLSLTLGTAVTFVNWFPAEEVHDRNSHLVVSASNAIEEFRRYWCEGNLGTVGEHTLEVIHTFGLREGVSFINRRRAFLTSGLNPNVVQKRIFSAKGLSYKGSHNESSQLWRNIISTGFGGGKKGDPLWDEAIVRTIASFLEKHDDFSLDAVTAHLTQSGLWPIPTEGKSGAPPSYYKMLQPGSYFASKNFRKAVSERQKVLTEKAEDRPSPLPDDFREFMINSLEALKLVSYDGNGEFYYDAYAKPWGQVCSHKSNAVNRILQQLSLFDDNAAIQKDSAGEIELVARFCQEMVEKLKVEKYQVRENQDNGVSQFLKFVEKMSIEDALEATENVLDARCLRNSNRQFLEFLATNHCSSERAAQITKAIRWHGQQERIKNAKLGYVADVLRRPLRPQYGKSKPPGELSLDSNGELSLSLSLLLSGGRRQENLKVKAARAKAEFLFLAPSEPTSLVPRNTKFHNPNDEHVELLKGKENETHAISVFARIPTWGTDPLWSIGITPKVYFERPTFDEMLIGMGIDLGWREPAAFTILRHGSELPIANGFINHEISRKNCAGIEKRSIFEVAATATPNLMNLTRQVWELFHSENERPLPNTMVSTSAIKSAASMLRRGIYRGITDDVLALIRILIDLVSPHFAQSMFKSSCLPEEQKSRLVWQGGLSYGRMEMMMALNSMISCLISIAERTGFSLDSSFEFMRLRIHQKLVSLRTERAKVTARMILKTAVEHNVQFIAVENLEVSSSRRKKKFINEGTLNWYSTRIIKFLEDEAPMHGIRLAKVNPNYSSHQDIDGSPVCRLMKVNPQTLPETTQHGKRYSSVRSITKKLEAFKEGIGGERGPIYQQATEKFLNGDTFPSVIQKAKAAGLTELLVPWLGGEYVQSKLSKGPISSDIVASYVMAQRGFERLTAKSHTKSERSGDEKNTATARSLVTSTT